MRAATQKKRKHGGAEYVDIGDVVESRVNQAITRSLPLRDRSALLKIRDKEDQIVPFIWSTTQSAYWELRGEEGYVLLLKYRQGGYTTFEMMDSYDTFKYVKESQQVLIGDTEEKAKMIFRIIDRACQHDPHPPNFLATPNLSTWQSTDNSLMFIQSAGARGAGARGTTLTKAKGTEVSRWPRDYDSTQDLILGLREACRGPKKIVVLETTPYGMDPWFYPTWHDPKDWNCIFLPWFLDPQYTLSFEQQRKWLGSLKKEQQLLFIERHGPIGSPQALIDTLTDEELALIHKAHLTMEQVAWRRVEMFKLGKRFLQEFPEDAATAFIVSGDTLYDAALISIALKKAPVALKRVGFDVPIPGVVVLNPDSKVMWEIFALVNPSLKYYIACDIAKGVEGGDWNAWSIRDQHGFQVEAGRCKDSPEDFARRMAMIGKRYNKALIAPELNNLGRSFLNTLVNECKYGNVWQGMKWDGVQWVNTGDYGWDTNSATRPAMIEDFTNAWNMLEWIVNSSLQLAEMRSVSMRKNGRYEGVPHDDMWFADMILLQIFKMRTALTITAA